MSRKIWIPASIAVLIASLATAGLLVRSTETAPEARFPISFRDDEGVLTRVLRSPNRVVALGPHLTESIFRLGKGHLLIATAGGETSPPEALVLPKVASGPSVDTVTIGKLAPDLVIAAGADHGGYRKLLRDAGIDVVTLEASSIADALADIRKLGRLLAVLDRAEALTKAIASSVDRNTQQGSTRVFVEAFYPPLSSAGSQGFVADLVRKAGGMIVPEGTGSQIGPEQVAAADPTVYLAPASSAQAAPLAVRPGFASIEAITRGRTAVIPDELLFGPGPRMGEAVRLIAAALKAVD